jgi:hypothetical protein
LAFTVCQTPVVYVRGDSPKIDVLLTGGHTVTVSVNCLDAKTTQHIFDRDGQVEMLRVTVQI